MSKVSAATAKATQPHPTAIPVDPDEVDNLLSQELKALSFQDRSMIQEEVHGVANLCPEESPVLLAEKLHEFRLELGKLQRQQRVPPCFGHIPPTSYLNDPEFQLRFLRCELFDARKAAVRFVKFIVFMVDQYDTELLERPLRLSDLHTKSQRGKEIMDCFKSGHIQLLPFRDRSGRRIITSLLQLALKFEVDLRFKLYQYLMYVASCDEETQRNGLVFVLWGFCEDGVPFPDREENIKIAPMVEALPIRISSLHFCFKDSPAIRMARAMIILMAGENKKRIITHLEDQWEQRYRLMGYGIPVDLFPFTETGNAKTKNLFLFLKARKAIEQMEDQKRRNNDRTPVELIECPCMTDVVYKVGTSSTSHPGNVMFRDLLEENFVEYNTTLVHSGKQTVITRIIDGVKERNGRFLEWDSRGVWIVIIDPVQIRAKVANSLLYYKRMISAKQNMQSSKSSTFIFERQDGRKRKRGDDGEEPSTCHCK